MTFEKGKSGNPSGRKKGSKNSKNLPYLRSVIEQYSDNLVTKAVELALNGDAAMIRFCLDKILPSYKSQDAPIVLPDFPCHHKNPWVQARFLVDAVVSGQISPSQGEVMINAIIKSFQYVKDKDTDIDSFDPILDWRFHIEQSKDDQSSET